MQRAVGAVYFHFRTFVGIGGGLVPVLYQFRRFRCRDAVVADGQEFVVSGAGGLRTLVAVGKVEYAGCDLSRCLERVFFGQPAVGVIADHFACEFSICEVLYGAELPVFIVFFQLAVQLAVFVVAYLRNAPVGVILDEFAVRQSLYDLTFAIWLAILVPRTIDAVHATVLFLCAGRFVPSRLLDDDTLVIRPFNAGFALAIEDHVLHIVSLQLVVEVVGLDAGLALVGGRAVGKPVLAIGAVEGSVRIGHGNAQCAVLHIEAVGAVLLPGSGVYGIDLVRSGAEQVVIRAYGLERLRVRQSQRKESCQ